MNAQAYLLLLPHLPHQTGASLPAMDQGPWLTVLGTLLGLIIVQVIIKTESLSLFFGTGYFSV